MDFYKKKLKSAANFIVTFLKWVAIAALTGAICGCIGSLFHISVEFATDFRVEHRWIIALLPIGGLAIAALYSLDKHHENAGTDTVIDSIRTSQHVPILMAPLIFIGTVITHLLGGSAGREGAALQLGGCIGCQVGRVLRLDERDMSLIVLSGMSGVFSALFGTPMTATFFALEVVSVGVIYYSGFVPCIVSAVVAYGVSMLFGLQPVKYDIAASIPEIDLFVSLKVILLAAVCALLSIAFCMAMKGTHRLMARYLKNKFVRVAVGGAAVALLSLIFSSGDYNGAGMNVISSALGGAAKPEAFLLKIIFTAITIGAGYKGGEIVPTFFIGATFGCVLGGLIGLNPAFGAAVGLVAMFCGVTNSPIASIVLSVELFDASGLVLFGIASGVSYMLSGYYGLYNTQKIVYSKLKAQFINVNAK